MGRPQLLASTVLDALDPDSGGLNSGTAVDIQENLRDRGEIYEVSRVREVLEDLVLAGSIERVEMEDPQPVYTRPDVLLRAIGVVKLVKGDRSRGPDGQASSEPRRKRVK